MTNDKQIDADAEALLKRAHSLENEAETKTLYRDWAKTYDKTMIDGLGYLSPEKGAELMGRCSLPKSARILDVGTGTGLVGKELSRLGFNNIDGIDYSAPMLAEAGETGFYNELVETDLNQQLAIDDATYDALICIGTFTHGHIGADCLDELFRILKPNGKFVTAIRKNYWHPAGFAKKVGQMIADGMLKTIISEENSNYVSSSEAESWFIVWEKL